MPQSSYAQHIKPNAYTIVNDKIGIRDGDQIRLVEGLPPQRAQRIRGLIRVRDAVRRCLRAQIEITDDQELDSVRLLLNQTYDRFVGHFGPISERVNTMAFRGDPDLPLLLSLEHYDETSKRAVKAAIFGARPFKAATGGNQNAPRCVVGNPQVSGSGRS